ncbi:MBL fold metallo-hydrolase [Verrucomicrobium sp. BvORR034]|uniref:MBL fold metallo-hydrolase n=1 Tax=Verrucomicrobium sp. BvORR034 TaxID=1396418 RepID=UPI0006793CC9|nr:MBL fold metallo-hydrolase [Verrucomicrobium sp. BvORR034]
MTFRSLLRRREIGANSYLIENGRQRIILDAGAHPKEKGHDSLPNFNSVPHDTVNSILVTHAHHDHIGALPVLQRRQPRTPVYMTEPTGEVGAAMLHNSVNVMTRQREEQGIQEYPLFTHKEIDGIKGRWNYRDLRRPFFLPDSEVECTFFDAGHIIGSAGIMIRHEGKTAFYTGDVNFEPQTIAREADFPTTGIDTLIIETTRGDFQRPANFSRKAEKERLAQVIRETFDKGGAVMIPVFALGKSQELLVMLHELHQMDLIPNAPVFIGGLSTKMTVLYDNYASKTRRSYEGFRILEDMDTLVAPRKRRKELLYNVRTIYALSSGMMSEGTTSNQFAMRFMDNPKNTIAFVGYTDPATPGYRIRNAKQGEKIKLDPQLPEVPLLCRVASFDFSAHAVREDIVSYVTKVSPRKVLLVHGDAPAQAWFHQTLSTALPQSEIISPEPGETISLW